LLARHFDLEVHPDIPDVGRFYQTVRLPPATARIDLATDGAILASRLVSAHAPVVTVLTPNGGDLWYASGMQVIAWTGSDADQGEVFYLVQYSSDGGQTWETLASNVTATFLPFDPALLPGSDQALVRVLASDGVNTGEDQSDAPFHVAPKDPRVFISGVNDDAVVEPGSVFTLLANYIDPDGQRVDESAFLWRSDRGDILGRGLRLELAANQLRPGPQRISLARIPAPHPPATSL
jgi:hypothetical protein